MVVKNRNGTYLIWETARVYQTTSEAKMIFLFLVNNTI